MIFGCMGSPSILGVVVPLTLSEPFTIGVAVVNVVEVDAAALVAFAGVSGELLIPFDETLDVASLGENVVGWVVEAAAASLGEVVASRGITAYRWAVVVGQFFAKNMAERARQSHWTRMAAASWCKVLQGGTQQHLWPKAFFHSIN